MDKKKSSTIRVLVIIAAVVVAVLVILFAVIPAIGERADEPGTDDAVSDVNGADTFDEEETGDIPEQAEYDDSDLTVGDSGLDSTDISALISALPDTEALIELHSLFSGYWISGNEPFVGFIYIDGVPGIDYGLYRSSFGVSGKIIDSSAISANEAELTILIPAMPETAMNDATPERTETVSIDINNFTDNRLNIKIESLAGGEWRTYEFGGSTLDDAAAKMNG